MGSKRIAILAGLVVAASAIVAVGDAGAVPEGVRLHIGSDGRYFEYGSTRQDLTTQNNSCKINSAEPVIDLAATGTRAAPGLRPDAIGVTSGSNSNGSPCSEVDVTETLVLRPGTALAGRLFTGVRLDLEVKGNAVVSLRFSRGAQSETYLLQTGTSITAAQSGETDYDTTVPYLVTSGPGDAVDACAAPNSSGPNSGPSDNCQWTVQGGFEFDTVTLTTQGAGNVSLEGSADFGNDPAHDSMFFLSNLAPTPVDDTATTNEDTAVSGNVLTNDSDPESNPLSANKLANPAHGSVTLSADGAFTYTPAANYFGPDSFTYEAFDGSLATSATVRITVNPVNDAPEAQNSSVSVDEDETVTVTVATDIDSTDLTVECTGAEGGTVVDNGDGTVDFTPPENFNGTIVLTCTATDDDGETTTSAATITVGVDPINDAPVAEDDTAEVNESDSVVIAVLGNDSDVDNDPLTPVVDGASLSPAGSTAVANADGTVTFTPPANYTGPASFTYRASDGVLTSNVATVDVTVYPVICSSETVTDSDGDVTSAFTRLDDSFNCKRYQLDASAADGTILFQPTGGADVEYRGFLTLEPEAAPVPAGPFTVGIEYDPTGGNTFRAMTWCVDPQFSGDLVTSASFVAGETWCIASAETRPDANGDLVTTWQVYGKDDPKFR